MKELHIPYGIQRLTGAIIEPEDATQGRACDCLCPGCAAPLLSRHPKSDDKRIHYAHDSKHPNAKPIEDCPLSPQVAMAMMARYISESLPGKTIKLGALERDLSFTCCLPGSTFITLVPEQDAIIENSQSSVSYGGVNYDIGLTLNGLRFFIDIVYGGKPKKELPAREFLDGIGGIMTLNANEYLAMMDNPEYRAMRYSESVEYFLLSYASQDWEYHHTEAESQADARKQHQCPPPLSTQIFGNRQFNSYPRYSSSFSQSTQGQTYDPSVPLERTVSCFYCGQYMTTRANKTPAMGHKCTLCRKYNRVAPHPRSLVTKESNHQANLAGEVAAKSGSKGYGDVTKENNHQANLAGEAAVKSDSKGYGDIRG